MPRADRMKAVLFLLCFSLASLTVLPSSGRQAGGEYDLDRKTPLDVDEIVRHLEEKDRERSTALRRFQGTRIYRIQYRGVLGNREAEMIVRFSYAAPGDKEFAVVSQSGSRFIIEHVFKGLLEGEKEAAKEENRQRLNLNARNYNFTFAGFDTSEAPPRYVLKVVPKTDHKFMYRGKIWVDAKDFAVTHIEAEPAKNPSFWIRKSEINLKYQKVDDFWLPSENRTKSWMRFGGHALLSIEYKNYKITESEGLEPSEGM